MKFVDNLLDLFKERVNELESKSEVLPRGLSFNVAPNFQLKKLNFVFN